MDPKKASISQAFPEPQRASTTLVELSLINILAPSLKLYSFLCDNNIVNNMNIKLVMLFLLNLQKKTYLNSTNKSY